MDRHALLIKSYNPRQNEKGFPLRNAKVPPSMVGLTIEFVNMNGADLRERDFSDANLSQGSAFSVKPVEGKKIHSDISGAKFVRAKMTCFKFGEVIAKGADFSSAILYNLTIYGGDFSKSNFGVAKLSGSTIRNADFSDCRFEGADLSSSVFIDSNLFKANLTAANLHDSNFIGVNFTETNLEGADFSGAQFEDCYYFDASGKKSEATENWLRSKGAVVSPQGYEIPDPSGTHGNKHSRGPAYMNYDMR